MYVRSRTKFTLNTQQIFSVHTMPKEFKNATCHLPRTQARSTGFESDWDFFSRSPFPASSASTLNAPDPHCAIFFDGSCGRVFETPRNEADLPPVMLNLCFRETRSGKSRDYHNTIVFQKLCSQNVFLPHEDQDTY